MDFAALLKRAIKRQGTTINEVAARIRVKDGRLAPSSLSRYATGKAEPKWSQACAIIEALELSVEEFIAPEGGSPIAKTTKPVPDDGAFGLAAHRSVQDTLLLDDDTTWNVEVRIVGTLGQKS